jgi:SanA protein
MKFAKKHFKKILLFILLFLVTWFFGANYLIRSNAEGKVFDSVTNCPEVNVGLVLGTSPTLRNGNPNMYFVYRIEAAVALYKAGKINYILVSGDNSSKEYDEPSEMRKALVAAGIPFDKIYLDYAGFRTLDSMERALKVFGQKKLIVISQQFHNERAIYLAEHFGIECYGFNAKDVVTMRGFKTKFRERFARMKVFWDVFWGVDSKFLGEPVKIRE